MDAPAGGSERKPIPFLATPADETFGQFSPDGNVTGFFSYDIGPDGRFLLNTVGDAAAPTSSPVTIVLNWQAGLRAR